MAEGMGDRRPWAGATDQATIEQLLVVAGMAGASGSPDLHSLLAAAAARFAELVELALERPGERSGSTIGLDRVGRFEVEIDDRVVEIERFGSGEVSIDLSVVQWFALGEPERIQVHLTGGS